MGIRKLANGHTAVLAACPAAPRLWQSGGVRSRLWGKKRVQVIRRVISRWFDGKPHCRGITGVAVACAAAAASPTGQLVQGEYVAGVVAGCPVTVCGAVCKDGVALVCLRDLGPEVRDLAQE